MFKILALRFSMSIGKKILNSSDKMISISKAFKKLVKRIYFGLG